MARKVQAKTAKSAVAKVAKAVKKTTTKRVKKADKTPTKVVTHAPAEVATPVVAVPAATTPVADIKDPIVWVDCEMTGLDIHKDCIIEIAVIVTDGQLEHCYEGPELVIQTSKEILDQMGEWCVKTHGESGLTQKCIDSTVTMEQAEQQILEFLKSLNIQPRKAVLGGNSVGEDKKFMEKDMRQIYDFLSYRIIDVSTIKELGYRWFPQQMKDVPKKKWSHRALDDIQESIQELKYYKNNLFIQL